ncbi:MAG TPA: sigma-70 family RNA polymerase sigma factor [Puia sp.]|nr:sigma-70 family RNA polymerase sigma factor [Puia sp.]
MTPFDTERTAYVFTHLFSPLHVVATRLLLSGPDAEDVVMTVIGEVMNGRSRPKTDEHLRRRLFVCVRHEAINILRRQQQQRRVYHELARRQQQPDTDPLTDPKFDEAPLFGQLSAEIKKLSPQRQLVIRFYFFDRMTTTDIASMLGLSKQTVLNHKTLALRHLRNSGLKRTWQRLHG